MKLSIFTFLFFATIATSCVTAYNATSPCKYSKNEVDDMSGMRVISMDRETAFRRTTMRGPESLEVYVSKINSSTFLTLTSYLLSDVYSVEKGRSVIVKFIDGTTLELENRESSVADYKKLGSSTTQWYASHRITLSKEDAAAFRNKPIQKIRLYSSDGYDDFDIDPKNNQLLMYLCNCVEKG